MKNPLPEVVGDFFSQFQWLKTRFLLGLGLASTEQFDFGLTVSALT